MICEELEKAQEELRHAEYDLLDCPSNETSEKYAEALKKLKAIKNRKENEDNGKIQIEDN